MALRVTCTRVNLQLAVILKACSLFFDYHRPQFMIKFLMIQLRVLFCSIIIFTLGCTHQKNVPVAPAAQPNVIIQCPEKRSPMCTREYRPVCATRDTGVRCVTTPCPSSEESTYGNACTACADEKVFEYRLGACEEEPTRK
jgi:hypothetical protein